MTNEEQQTLADELERELQQSVPPPPQPQATNESFEALLSHNNNPVYPSWVFGGAS